MQGMLEVAAQAPGLLRGRVTALEKRDDHVLVELADGRELCCARLYVADGAGLTLRVGDAVLVHPGDDTGVVVGRIGPGQALAPPATESVPDELTLQARTSLTLCVGDGSITLRKDGRILIKGQDLVSHARGMNRIRGGSVTIN